MITTYPFLHNISMGHVWTFIPMYSKIAISFDTFIQVLKWTGLDIVFIGISEQVP